MTKFRIAKLTSAERKEIARVLSKGGDEGVDLRQLFRRIRNRPKHPLYNRLRLDPDYCVEELNVRILRDVFEAYRVEVRFCPARGGSEEIRSIPGAVSVGAGYRDTNLVIENVRMADEQIRSEWKRRDSIDARILDLVSVVPEFEEIRECIERQREELRAIFEGLSVVRRTRRKKKKAA